MLKNLYFFQNYNDYFNRELKWHPTLNDYVNAIDNYTVIQNVNFDINDNVNASIVVPEADIADGMSAGIWRHGTYMIAQDVYTSAAQDTDISRWFVVEAEFIRQGRYNLTLRRDLVADFLEPLLKSTIYVEKGYIRNNTDTIDNYNPLAFNQEAFSANQIKKAEVSIKDRSGCKWVVGYLNKDSINESQTIKTYLNESLTPSYVYSSIENSFFNYFIDPTSLKPKKDRKYLKTLTAEMDVHNKSTALDGGEYWRYTASKTSCSRVQIDRSQYKGNLTCSYDIAKFPDSLSAAGIYDSMVKTTNEAYGYLIPQEEWEQGKAANGKILYIRGADKYYRINVSTTTQATTSTKMISPNGPNAAVYQDLKSYVGSGPTPCDKVIDSDNNFRTKLYFSESLTMELIEEVNDGYSLTIDPTKFNKTINESYDVFAIPVLEETCLFLYGTANDSYDLTNSYYSSNYNSAFAVGQALSKISSQILDLQLLPFAPLPEAWFNRHVITQAEIDAGKISAPYLDTEVLEIATFGGKQQYDFELILGEDEITPVNMIFFLSSAQFNKTVSFRGIRTGEEDEDPAITNATTYSTIEEVKCRNQLDTWRLYSGDYSSSFEFNMARNGGISFFEVDCAYKPFHPYIHVAPNFGGLYGSDFNDTRGLICSNANYSLPRMTSAWETYERNNINYMNAFNRQIENMDVNRRYQRMGETAQAWAGGFSAGGSGAALGSLVPGVKTAISAVAGGVIGGAVSTGLGFYDRYLNDQLYKENKQYSIDQFNMNLENIQAQPNTATAIGALNPNNKVFPQLVFYSCSETEKNAFIQKMKWNGMTVGVITEKIEDYINPDDKSYFKGQLIYMPLDEVNIESHELAELANELAKGILIDKGVIQ